VPFEYRLGPVVVPGHDPADLLRVLLLAEAGRARDVAEEYGDGLANLERRPGLRSRERASAREAKAGSLRVLLAAPGASGHGRECTELSGRLPRCRPAANAYSRTSPERSRADESCSSSTSPPSPTPGRRYRRGGSTRASRSSRGSFASCTRRPV